MKIITPIPFLALLLLGCQSTSTKTSPLLSVVESSDSSAIKPIKGLEIEPEIYTINANQASVIELPSGSRISFPADAFVDESGNPIKGKVDVHWNEYHTLTDILLSGIPMQYDSAGVSSNLVSGGMFSISAEQNDKEINIATGKTAKIDIASINDSPCMNFYKLDEKEGDWAYKTTKESTPIEKPIVEPKQDDQFSVIDAEVNIDNFPELKNKQIVGWKTSSRIPKKEKKILNDKKAVCTLTKTEDSYSLNVDYNGAIKVIEVEPYLLETALADTKKLEKVIKDETDELLAFQEKVANGSVVRSIEIKGFGTYNWDRMLHRTDIQTLTCDYDFPTKVNPKFVSMFLVSPDENSIIRCGLEEDSKILFDPRKRNFLVGIMPDNSVVSFNSKDFVKANNAPKNSMFRFQMKKTGVTLSNGSDLSAYLKELI